MTANLTPEEFRRVERVARICAVSAAASAPLIAVPAAFAASARILPLFGLAADLPSFAWHLALGALAAAWAVYWTARHAPAMVRARLPQAAREHRR